MKGKYEMILMEAMDELYAAKNFKTKAENQENAEKLGECLKVAMDLYAVRTHNNTQQLIWDMGFRDDEFLDWLEFLGTKTREMLYYYIMEELTYETV